MVCHSAPINFFDGPTCLPSCFGAIGAFFLPSNVFNLAITIVNIAIPNDDLFPLLNADERRISPADHLISDLRDTSHASSLFFSARMTRSAVNVR